jgi:hypothetical protein
MFGLTFFWWAFLKSCLWGKAGCGEKLAEKNPSVWFGCCEEKLVVTIWVFGYADSGIVDSKWKKESRQRHNNQHLIQ